MHDTRHRQPGRQSLQKEKMALAELVPAQLLPYFSLASASAVQNAYPMDSEVGKAIYL